MATANRTIQFFGYAYGNAPVQLNAHINGELVFSGAVDTINEPLPAPPNDLTNAPVLFSVVDSPLFPTDFEGSYPMTVSVATGYGILLGNTYCNYMGSSSDPSGGTFTPGSEDVFLDCYGGQPEGGLPNSEGTEDSRSSVTLDDVVQVPPLPKSSGQWTWLVPQGSTLGCNFNISAGSVGNVA